MKTEVIKIESGMIECPVVNDQRYVAIKPVCEILGVDPDSQRQVIQTHPLFASTAVFNPVVAGWKSHATLTLLATQDCPLWLQYD